MNRTTSILKYVLVALVIFLLGTLAWWYLFLGAKQGSLETTDSGRGAGVAAPTFGEAIGSTYGNIVSSISSFVSGTTETAGENDTSRLWQITKTPVAGANFITNGTSSIVRFVERGTGYVLEATPESKKVERITNTLMPRVYEALIGQSGSIILRSTDDAGQLLTSAGQLPPTSTSTVERTPSALVTRQLPTNIRTIAMDSKGDEIVYVAPTPSGTVSVMRAAWNGTGVGRIGTLGISGWQIEWLSDNRMIFVQDPGESQSYAYEFGTNGALTPLTDPAIGLSVLPHPGSPSLLYSSSAGGVQLIARADLNTEPITLPIRTLADKCVWVPGETYVAYCAVPQTDPGADFVNARLKGEEHSTDAWWRVDVRSGRAQRLPSESAPQIDVENPVMDAGGKYIVFMNARDKSLWLLRVQQ